MHANSSHPATPGTTAASTSDASDTSARASVSAAIMPGPGSPARTAADIRVTHISPATRILTCATRAALPACMVLGILAAFAVVIAWFPKGPAAWEYPLHQIDAPAHYYFIRRLLDEGLGAATHLWPNDAYYPPLYHLLCVGLIKLAALFGITVNVYTALNLVWIVTSGLLWPAGMQLLASYWTCRSLREERRAQNRVRSRSSAGILSASDCPASTSARTTSVSFRRLWFPCAMALIVPLLSVASASHPFQMLASGPLIAYGLATTLLPFWLYATLRLFDAVAARFHRVPDPAAAPSTVPGRRTARHIPPIALWTALTLFTGVLCVFAHPRIAFTWLLFIGPFILLRLPWKLILAAAAVVVAGAGAFFVYMITHYRSDRYLDPSSWFHTFVPNRTVPDALRVWLTDNIPGWAGWLMAALVVAAVVVTVVMIAYPPARRDQSTRHDQSTRRSLPDSRTMLRKDAVSLLLVFGLIGLVYVCSTALTGWFPNIVAAAWYRAETRPLTMLPLGIVPLLTFATCALYAANDSPASAASAINNPREIDVTALQPASHRMSHAAWHRMQTPVAVLLLAVLAIGAQVNNPTRAQLATGIYANMELTDDQPEEQLTATKYRILKDVAHTVGSRSVVISDPLNGSMYGKTIFDTNMLYPIYNPMAEKNGAIFGEVERAFDSGDRNTVLSTVCPIVSDAPAYFLAMGGQAPSLQMFTFRAQYDPFHREDVISRYVADGTLVKVRDYSHLADYASGWALYRFDCAQ